MNSDCAYRIGRSHAVCQDYAVAGGSQQPYVILADGCSSSPDTDVGARLLARAAERLVRQGQHGRDDYPEQAAVDAACCAAYLGLDLRCLDATLLTATVSDGRWRATLHGDGVAALLDRDGRLHIHAVSYTEGFPAYPSYTLDPARSAAFAGRTENRRQVERTVLGPDGAVQEVESETAPSGAGCFSLSGYTDRYRWIALLSDGAQSFTDTPAGERQPATTRVPLPDVLGELLAFRNLNGVFVQRRVQRCLQQCAARGRYPQDDVSLGVIAFGA